MKKTVNLTLILSMIPQLAFAGDKAWGYLAAALSVGFSTVAAGIAVGMVGAAAMGTVGERPEMSGKALIFLGLAEGIAIYGLIVSILILGKL